MPPAFHMKQDRDTHFSALTPKALKYATVYNGLNLPPKKLNIISPVVFKSCLVLKTFILIIFANIAKHCCWVKRGNSLRQWIKIVWALFLICPNLALITDCRQKYNNKVLTKTIKCPLNENCCYLKLKVQSWDIIDILTLFILKDNKITQWLCKFLLIISFIMPSSLSFFVG